MSQRRLQKEQRNGREGAVAGPQALQVAECVYYGTEAITRDFPFALRLVPFVFFRIFRIIVERAKEKGTEKEDSNP